MSREEHVGKFGSTPVDAIAHKAAEKIRRAQGPRALCVDPAGRVTVERWDHAVTDEIIGHFDRSAGWPALELLVRDELKAAMAERRANG